MSILDVWEKKATAFTRKTREKTAALTETTRLRSLISGEEKNFRSLCDQVGQEYVKRHKDDPEAEFPELMQMCRESLDRKEGYARQILQVQKLRVCPACGEKVPLDFAFCNFCGARLPEVEIDPGPGFRRCSGCGAVIPDTMKFCRHCGAQQPLEETKEAPAEPADGPRDAPEEQISPEADAETREPAAEKDTALEVLPEEDLPPVPEAQPDPEPAPEEDPEKRPEPVSEVRSPVCPEAEEVPLPEDLPPAEPASRDIEDLPVTVAVPVLPPESGAGPAEQPEAYSSTTARVPPEDFLPHEEEDAYRAPETLL